MNRLNAKVALITGAARGIGAAIARAYVAEGARVILSDIDDAAGMALAQQLQAQYLHLDVTNEANWQAVSQRITQDYQALHIMVNNAGVTGLETPGVAHDPEHTELSDWHRVMTINLDSVFLGCKYAIQTMRKTTSAGAIINMSSRSGIVGVPGAAAYAASKAAIRNHTKSVALYCAQQGLAIRCNSIHPAAIMTPMWEMMLGQGQQRVLKEAQLLRDSPLHRFGQPEEVAAVAVLLGSDEACYMTGSEITLDGGILAGSSTSPTPAKN